MPPAPRRRTGDQTLESPLPAGAPGEANPVDLGSDLHDLRERDDQWPRERWAWRARVRANPLAYFWYRLGVALVGALMMVGAALTGWLPGPGGIPLFMLGLVVWSSEFTWAHRVMLWFRRAFDWFLGWPDRTRHLFYVGCLVAAICTWYGLAVWHGIPSWMPAGAAAQLDRLPGIER
ncbi:putative transmembrane protein PGPGW [Luteococcus japonicus]|uniref:Putative transmembrane protein PGPGW n=1 Tax=Luteococcus japonicus TaxID=33984 RepID=A0A3N1ZR39_9ACTN|nr:MULTISPECIES: PGPGW domain-containing protein [Luteococcus]MDN5562909.1 PGPGW domain-containing protein [Luteococcus sp.]ROR53361.1 putative transmembrane protein PGPGW [Luteococcus japonicus]